MLSKPLLQGHAHRDEKEIWDGADLPLLTSKTTPFCLGVSPSLPLGELLTFSTKKSAEELTRIGTLVH